MDIDARLAKLGWELPPASKPVGVYRPLVICGSMAYLSGHGPLLPDGSLITGRVGDNLDLDAGYHAARQVGLAVLATLQSGLGSLNRVRRIVKVLGLVSSSPEFFDHPKVINGFSDVFAELYGPENGIGARSAVGAAALPANIAVEVEAILEIL